MANLSSSPKVRELFARVDKSFPPPIRFQVFFRSTSAVPVKLVWSRIEEGNKPGVGIDGERVLGRTLRFGSSVMIRRAKSDELTRDLSHQSFASCLCVPVSELGEVFCLLYLSSPEPDTFSTHQKLTLERLAAKYSSALSALRNLEIPGAETPIPGSSKTSSLLALGIVGLCLVPLLGLLNSGATPDQQDKPKMSQTRELKAKDMARRLTQELKMGEYAEVWEQFEPSLRERWPRKTFSKAIREWSQTELNQIDLLNREVSWVKQLGPNHAEAMIGRQESEDEPWVWTFEKHDSEWFMTSMNGPLSNP